MPRFCAVVGCSNRSNREINKKYFYFPAVRDRRGREVLEGVQKRKLWVAALHRADFTEEKVKNANICSDHFLSGYPSNDPLNPDYVPHINMGYGSAKEPAHKLARYDRAKKRNLLAPEESVSIGSATSSAIINSPEADETVDVTTFLSIENKKKDQTTQTDDTYMSLMKGLHDANATIYQLREHLRALNNNAESFAGDDEKTRFFTGLQSYKSLEMITSLIYPFLCVNYNITPFQQILLTLIRLRLNVSFRFLGYHFNIHESTVSRIFLKTIKVMYRRLKNFIIWPTRHELVLGTPQIFKEYFGSKVVVIIDCFEIKIEKSKNLLAQATTWSNYKHDNTMKVLIGITPQGSISFISQGYGGRISDKKITEESGILENLLPGDVILADRGFLIQELVKIVYGADIKTPAFLKGRKQLQNKEVEDTRRLAAVRVHVERVIGLLRKKYQILHHIIPITLLKKKDGEIGVIDEILTVCAALINLCPPIVPQD